MDAIKLLGDLLGNQSMARGGLAQNILKTILAGSGGGVPGAQAPRPQLPHQQQRATQPQHQHHDQHAVEPMRNWDTPARSPADVMRGGGESGHAPDDGMLGGLIRQAVERYGQRPGTTATHSTHAMPPRPQVPAGGHCEQSNSHAEVLIRAMINAAKSDGKIDQQEQDRIISKLGHLSQEEINFLSREFAQPLNVAQFVQQVPRGLEQQVYALSLTAIDLDTNREASYLNQLAQAMRIDPETCNQIHAQLGAPQLYR